MYIEKPTTDDVLSPLTDEALRDIARNDSAPRLWKKAAVKFLIQRQHKYQHHPDLRELVSEINEEMAAEKEVQAIIESAIEESLE